MGVEMTRVRCFLGAMALLLVGCGGSEGSEGSDDSTKAQLVVGGDEVSCHIGTGSGNAPDPGVELECEFEFSDCTDGRTYQAVCTSTQGSGTTECSCYIDGAAVGDPFALDGECGVEQDDAIAACNWAG